MALISRKKDVYTIGDPLRGYLRRHGRVASLPIRFEMLSRYLEAVPLYDAKGKDTLWQTVIYPPSEREEIDRALVRTYASLKVMGRMSLMEHLVTDRVDICT